MDLSPTVTIDQTITGQKLHLASKDGLDCTLSGTLDLTAFTIHVDARGMIPAGTPVVKSGNLYIPCLTRPAGVDTQNAACDGHTVEDTPVAAGSTKSSFALHWRGAMNKLKVPKPTGYAAAFDATKGSKFIKYV